MVQAALVHKCQYWHADMKKLAMKGDRRKENIENEQWGTWEDDKAQLYMDMHDMRQQQTVAASSASQNEHDEKHDEPAQDQIAAEGNFWQMSATDKRKTIAKAKAAIKEELMNQLENHPGQSSTKWEPTNWQEAWSENVSPGQPSFPWLPDFQGSTMQNSGAPKGTPFLGTVADIEFSMRQGGWDVNDLPGETIDQKWFHFVYRKPLSGYENDPFFTNKEATSSKDGGDPQDPM